MSKGRFFNRSERRALYLIAGGRCECCGVELQKGWAADHVVAHAIGGSTDVTNGQALCPPCNLKKGASMKSIYSWQDGFEQDFAAKIQSQDVYSLVACPGAGKTTASLKVAKRQLVKGIKRVVICAHNEEICNQWRSTGTKLGLDLYCGWRTEHGSQVDYQGFVVTYQSLATNAEGHRELCSRYPTLLVIDEAHHIGTDLPWNAAINRAFEPVRKTLVISGTPFRHDGRLPAFIEHTRDPETGELMRKVDWRYSYRSAVEDQVCREIYFPHFDGETEWISRSGERQSAKISDDELPRHLESERNRAALDAKGDWIRTVFIEANAKLTECRQAGHDRAAGLILASDRNEAHNFERALAETTGERAIVVVSGEPGSSGKIAEFRKSNDRWVIAVKMISEGVDIPRLQVLVYATICQTELNFLQAMGRITRAGEDEEKYLAYAFLPHRKEFLEYAARMREERDAALANIRARIPMEPIDAGTRTTGSSMFMPLASSAIPMGVLGSNGNVTPEEIDYARQYKQTHHLKYSPEVIAEVLRPARISPAASSEAATPTVEAPIDRQAKVKRLRDQITDVIGRYGKEDPDRSYEWYHIEWMKKGGHRQAAASEEELERKLAWLLSLRRAR
jgi:superfamily II DNA or RNA helicase